VNITEKEEPTMPPVNQDPIILGPPGAPVPPKGQKVTIKSPPSVLSLARKSISPGAHETPEDSAKWIAADLRDTHTFHAFPGPAEQQPGCAAFATAVAMRASLARRGADPGWLNPYYLWGVARGSDAFGNNPATGLLDVLRVANEFGTTVGTHRDTPTFNDPSFDTIDDLDRYLNYKPNFSVGPDSFVNLGIDLKNWHEWLVRKDGGPILAVTNIEVATFNDPIERKGHGFFIQYDPAPARKLLTGSDSAETSRYASHVVLLVGFDPAERAFIVMNPVSEKAPGTWGDRGFALLEVAKAVQCLAAGYGLLFSGQRLPATTRAGPTVQASA
jgi:hypothetical protein